MTAGIRAGASNDGFLQANAVDALRFEQNGDVSITRNLLLPNDTGWATQTVVPSTGAGALANANAVWRWRLQGKTAWFNCVCSIISNGTGASSIIIPLPTGWSAKATSSYAGQGATVSGKAFSARIFAAGTIATLLQYDAVYPGANGETLVFNGVLELT